MNEQERLNIENEIAQYKQLLSNTDYMALKHADGALTDEEYATMKANRADWREKINTLEEKLKGSEEAG